MSACLKVVTSTEPDGFSRTLAYYEATIRYAQGCVEGRFGQTTLSQLEEEMGKRGREMMRTLLEETLAKPPDAETVLGIEGEDGVLRLHERSRLRRASTKFGVVEYARSGFSAPEAPSIMPKDGALNMPPTQYSFGVQQLVAEEVSKGAFSEASAVVERETGLTIHKRQVQEIVVEAAKDVDEFYDRRRAGMTAPEGNLVVLTVDGKGVVVRKEDLREVTRKRAEQEEHKLSSRLSRGEKRNAKRMATVASVYTIAPHERTAEDILRELRPVGPVRARPRPAAKRVWASIEKSSQEVIAEACQEAVRRDRLRNRDLVVLVDGQDWQLEHVKEQLLAHRLEGHIVLDIIHVIEYLWKASRCFYGEASREGEAWVSEQLYRILQSETQTVVRGLRRKVAHAGLDEEKRGVVGGAIKYLTEHEPYMDYGQYLRRGYPISTGVIEGACRYLVKDRMDITGARWTLSTAEAVLKLRSVYASDDFDEYWGYHELRELQRNHESRVKRILPVNPAPPRLAKPQNRSKPR
jgi:hypothetical protein